MFGVMFVCPGWRSAGSKRGGVGLWYIAAEVFGVDRLDLVFRFLNSVMYMRDAFEFCSA
jgi:hypothetical protein